MAVKAAGSYPACTREQNEWDGCSHPNGLFFQIFHLPDDPRQLRPELAACLLIQV